MKNWRCSYENVSEKKKIQKKDLLISKKLILMIVQTFSGFFSENKQNFK